MFSICVIAKDEEKNIRNCLQQLKPLGYELVVVDTGSQDRTKEIAFEYTDKVYDYVWTEDFSAARNYAAEKAENDYIIMVDCDEILVEYNKNELEKIIKSNPEKVGRIERNNLFVRDRLGFQSRENVNRVYSRSLFTYSGKVHEQITSITGSDYETCLVPLSFEHSGYNGTGSERIAKSERNLKLLKKMLEEQPEDPYILYQLAKAYYYKEDFESAEEYLKQALDFDLDPRLEYVSDMIETYGYTLINTGHKEYALSLAGVYDEFSYSADFVFMMGYIYMQNEQFEQAIEEFLKATKYKESKVEGVNSYMAYYNAGVIKECLGSAREALEYYKKCGNYAPAMEGKKRCSMF